MAAAAEDLLREKLGPSQAGLLRVKKEPYCLHVEVDEMRGASLIEERKTDCILLLGKQESQSRSNAGGIVEL